ncbi:excalibur calcium-binding domain-containing protein, partial [Rubellimicrobium rubrum]|uniref:excalibur calcium-binding domain-containing protein n=1 Tax=Rubellimicrobium rubrum TaxID=2585369 RepID=UPI003CCC8B06
MAEPAPLPPRVIIPSRSTPAPAGDVFYSSCSSVRAAGTAPVFAGEPGYRPALD